MIDTIDMNQNEFDMTIDRFFDGAARVRAKKHKHLTKPQNVYQKFSSRVISQMWDEERKANINAA